MTPVPGTSVVEPSVFTIDRLADGFRVSVSVAVLLVVVGSVTPVGAVIETVFVSEPVVPTAMVAVRVYVAEPPESRFTVSLIDPEPEAAHVEPDVATQVHVAPLSDGFSVSRTAAPTTLDGPLFDATIVYVTLVPGISVVVLSLFVTARSANGTNVSVSVDVLFDGIGSVVPVGPAIDAVLTNDPVALPLIVALRV